MTEGFSWLFLAGLVGGVLGGMGLGGGTLLIPILTLLLHVEGKVAAWLNLISFLPMSVVALALHSRNGYVSWEDVCAFVPTAFFSAAVASFFAPKMDGVLLRKIFGWFLILVGTVSLIVSFVTSAQNKEKSVFEEKYKISEILHK
ncbi:MAG: sulfite exporter TauE/SafE family protein [Clostridia bacterium]|nr:sulfite exporter TauE/SafE family protein [Clostridia bacterium]